MAILTDYTELNNTIIATKIQEFTKVKDYIDNKGITVATAAQAQLDAATVAIDSSIAILSSNSSSDLATSEANAATALANAVTTQTAVTDGMQESINALTILTNSNDLNLDTIQEIVDLIKATEEGLANILVNDLTTGGATKALTAEQGKILKGLYDSLEARVVVNEADIIKINAGIVNLKDQLVATGVLLVTMFS